MTLCLLTLLQQISPLTRSKRLPATSATYSPSQHNSLVLHSNKILVRMEKFLVKVEKNIVYSWQDWSCYLEAVIRGLSSGHKERGIMLLVPLRNVISEWRMLQNREE